MTNDKVRRMAFYSDLGAFLRHSSFASVAKAFASLFRRRSLLICRRWCICS